LFNTEKKYLLIILIITLFEIGTHWGIVLTDSPGYISTMHYFLGDEDERIEKRLVRPLTPVLAAPLSGLIGDVNAFALVNSIFWILAALMMFRFSNRLTNNPKLSIFASLLFTTSIPMLQYGAGVLTDSGGYFFTLLTLYVLAFHKENSPGRYILHGVILALAILAREHVAVTIFFFLLFYVLIYRKNPKRFVILLLIPVVIILPYYTFFQVDVISPYTDVNTGAMDSVYTGSGEGQGIRSFAISFIASLLFLPLFAILGFLFEKSRENIMIYYSLFLSSLLLLMLWPAFINRITFLVFPLVIPLSVLGMRVFSRKLAEKPGFSILGTGSYELLILLVYIIVSNLHVLIDLF
jgi:4-amino-4-deoxy-L-arabinose transferase-like glycosyltransferase